MIPEEPYVYCIAYIVAPDQTVRVGIDLELRCPRTTHDPIITFPHLECQLNHDIQEANKTRTMSYKEDNIYHHSNSEINTNATWNRPQWYNEIDETNTKWEKPTGIALERPVGKKAGLGV